MPSTLDRALVALLRVPALLAPARAADLDVNAGVLSYLCSGPAIANQLAVAPRRSAAR